MKFGQSLEKLLHDEPKATQVQGVRLRELMACYEGLDEDANNRFTFVQTGELERWFTMYTSAESGHLGYDLFDLLVPGAKHIIRNLMSLGLEDDPDPRYIEPFGGIIWRVVASASLNISGFGFEHPEPRVDLEELFARSSSWSDDLLKDQFLSRVVLPLFLCNHDSPWSIYKEATERNPCSALPLLAIDPHLVSHPDLLGVITELRNHQDPRVQKDFQRCMDGKLIRFPAPRQYQDELASIFHEVASIARAGWRISDTFAVFNAIAKDIREKPFDAIYRSVAEDALRQQISRKRRNLMARMERWFPIPSMTLPI